MCEDKQDQLDALLEELSEIAPGTDDARVKEIGGEMCTIYRTPLSNGMQFRHQYHFFLETLQSIRYPDYIDALMTNLKTIIGGIDEKNGDNKEILAKLMKLYDHISIDVVRMSMMSDTRHIYSKIMRTEGQIDHLEQRTDDTQKKVESLQMETVAILGVFAAIVIGFAGGLDVIGGALSNVGTEDFPLVLFSVSLTGLVLFDAVWLLMECVFRIVKDRAGGVVPWLAVAIFNGLMIGMMTVASCWMN